MPMGIYKPGRTESREVARKSEGPLGHWSDELIPHVRTDEPSDQWTVGPMGLRTYGLTPKSKVIQDVRTLR